MNRLRKGLLIGGAVIAIVAPITAAHEGLRQKTYRDTGNVLTICYGHTGPDVHPNDTKTKEECRALLDTDLATAARAVDRWVTVPVSVNTRAALTDFVYNVGEGAFAHSMLLKKLNAGNLQGACDELRRWVYDNGRKLQGLVERREMERALCLK